MPPELGKSLIIFGLVLIIIGIVFLYADKLQFLTKIPGNIAIEKENFSFYFPLGTCILISAVLSLISWWFNSK
jgi:hypothetical protein